MNAPQSVATRASAVQIHGKWWSLPIQVRTKNCTNFFLPEGDRKSYLHPSRFAPSASHTSARRRGETDLFRLNTDLKDKVEHKNIAKQVRRE